MDSGAQRVKNKPPSQPRIKLESVTHRGTAKPRPLHPERSRLLGWGQAQLPQRFLRSTTHPTPGLRGRACLGRPCSEAGVGHPPWTGVTVLVSIWPLASEPSRSPLPLQRRPTCPWALPSSCACNTQAPAEASPFRAGAEGKPTTAGKGRRWAKGVAHPHPFPHQLRLTELEAIAGRKDVQDQQPHGVRLGDELCRGNRSTVTSHKNQDQPQTTKSVGQSP